MEELEELFAYERGGFYVFKGKRKSRVKTMQIGYAKIIEEESPVRDELILKIEERRPAGADCFCVGERIKLCRRIVGRPDNYVAVSYFKRID